MLRELRAGPNGDDLTDTLIVLRIPNGTQNVRAFSIPRDSFVGTPLHRVELRLLQRIPLHGKAALDGSLDVFNLFNRANIATYNLTETNANYGKPNASTNLAYAPRTVQLGFRLTF